MKVPGNDCLFAQLVQAGGATLLEITSTLQGLENAHGFRPGYSTLQSSPKEIILNVGC